MTASENDNQPAALRAGIEAAEAAIRGMDDDEELVACLSYVIALALEHRLDTGSGIIESLGRLASRVDDGAIDILGDWRVGKSGGLKRQREFLVDCDGEAAR